MVDSLYDVLDIIKAHKNKEMEFFEDDPELKRELVKSAKKFSIEIYNEGLCTLNKHLPVIYSVLALLIHTVFWKQKPTKFACCMITCILYNSTYIMEFQPSQTCIPTSFSPLPTWYIIV